tara:strand:+ start:415 stop:591 length:177 start_codon:yes stop_codon:yes gene_type:complete
MEADPLARIELNTLERTFEYEKVCRLVDGLTEEDAKLMAKCYAKLYLANLENLDYEST